MAIADRAAAFDRQRAVDRQRPAQVIPAAAGGDHVGILAAEHGVGLLELALRRVGEKRVLLLPFRGFVYALFVIAVLCGIALLAVGRLVRRVGLSGLVLRIGGLARFTVRR